MNSTTVTILGALVGLTIFLGLPVARLRALSRRSQGFLNALATGVLIFLLVDILSKAIAPINSVLGSAHKGETATLVGLVAIYVAGLATGLLGLVYFNRAVLSRIRLCRPKGPGAAVASALPAVPTARNLALMIACGLGLHNFSEGLAIGQSAAAGALAFTGVLMVGFGLHNITEGFGVAAPMAGDEQRPSWTFLGLAGLIGGGPTFLGTMIGYRVVSDYAFVLFLALAAGALIYVINEMFVVCRRLTTQSWLAPGLLLGFLAAFGTDLFLTYLGG